MEQTIALTKLVQHRHPSIWVIGVCVLNIGLFVYMAFDDERVLARSPLAADYKSYTERVGKFLPRFSRKQS